MEFGINSESYFTEYQKELKNLSKALKDKELDFLADMLDDQKGFDKQ